MTLQKFQFKSLKFQTLSFELTGSKMMCQNTFYDGPNVSQACVMAPPLKERGTSNRKDKNRHFLQYLVWKYIRHLGSCDIIDNSESSNSSDNINESRQEHTCIHDFETVCFRNRQYLEFGGPLVCAISALITPTDMSRIQVQRFSNLLFVAQGNLFE